MIIASYCVKKEKDSNNVNICISIIHQLPILIWAFFSPDRTPHGIAVTGLINRESNTAPLDYPQLTPSPVQFNWGPKWHNVELTLPLRSRKVFFIFMLHPLPLSMKSFVNLLTHWSYCSLALNHQYIHVLLGKIFMYVISFPESKPCWESGRNVTCISESDKTLWKDMTWYQLRFHFIAVWLKTAHFI